MRKAAENGHTPACSRLAARMYGDCPYARQVGHVEVAEPTRTAGVATAWAIGMVMLVTGILGTW